MSLVKNQELVGDIDLPTGTLTLFKYLDTDYFHLYKGDVDLYGKNTSEEINKCIINEINKYFAYDHIKNIHQTITGVAIKDTTGRVHSMSAPARHHHLIWWMRGKIDELIGAQHKNDFTPAEQGFITNTGEYVNRCDARVIALAASQCETTSHATQLFSEDLW